MAHWQICLLCTLTLIIQTGTLFFPASHARIIRRVNAQESTNLFFLLHGRQPALLLGSVLPYPPPEHLDHFSRNIVDIAEDARQLARVMILGYQPRSAFGTTQLAAPSSTKTVAWCGSLAMWRSPQNYFLSMRYHIAFTKRFLRRRILQNPSPLRVIAAINLWTQWM